MIQVRPDGSVYVHILGQCASKANRRRLVVINGMQRSIKCKEALDFIDGAMWQIPPIPQLLEGELRADLKIYYRSNRSDLDESIIFDILQKRVYKNDRQIFEKHVEKLIDEKNPRVIGVFRRRNQDAETSIQQRKVPRKRTV